MPILGILASSVPAAAGDYDSIATVTVGSGGSSSITFSSIPSTYAHLQVRAVVLTSTSTNYLLGFNGDSGANYTAHRIEGNGSSVGAAAFTGIGRSYIGFIPNTSYPGTCIIDILDYANTNKYKVSRTLEGSDVNGATGYMTFWSGMWLNTAAINAINIVPVSGNFAQYSHFALYGIKSA
jgi:hypothetical protein